MTQTAVFTDLDGTLLDHFDYSYDAALPAIERLRRSNIPLILVSSKTRAEMAELCRCLDITDPYVCENGSVIVMPKPWAERFVEDHSLLEDAGDVYLQYRGASRSEILPILANLAEHFTFTGYANMTVNELMDATGLTEQAAQRSMQREGTEPLIWRDSEASMNDFALKLGEYGLRLLKGGRFYHVMANCDKGDSVRYLLKLYQDQFGAKVFSIALGDSPNDLQMLKAVDQAIVMPHPDGTYMPLNGLNNAILAPVQGAKGWRVGVEKALDNVREETE